MIEFINTWAKNLGLAIVIVSILEMLLPNNKTKKYIRMVMGIYILFCILSPWFKNNNILQNNTDELLNSITNQTVVTSTQVDSTSMDNHIQKLYIEELEKDIIKKLKEKGYELSKCKVNANISNKDEEAKIEKIQIKINQKIQIKTEEKEDELENKIITEIQKIKPINLKVEQNESEKQPEEENKITKSDIQNVKKFLIEEYGVNEKCLEIN